MSKSDRPNILLIVLDSVRAKNTSIHGHVNRTTPFLEEFEERATRYEYAHSPSVSTPPSHISMFTGLHVAQHPVEPVAGSQNSDLYRLRSDTTVWEVLQNTHGYDTGIFTTNAQFKKPQGLSSGFHTKILDNNNLPFENATDPRSFGATRRLEYLSRSLQERRPLKTMANGISLLLSQSSINPVDSFLEWSDNRENQWAAFLNLMDAHAPYVPDQRYNEWADEDIKDILRNMGGGHRNNFYDTSSRWQLAAFESLYDGAIRQADAKVKHIISTMKERGDFENTLVVVTADHGEAFGEPSRLYPTHRLIGHCLGVHEVLTHVPLLVSKPFQTDNNIIREPASLTLFPSVVESALKENLSDRGFVPKEDPVFMSHFIGRPSGESGADQLPVSRYIGDRDNPKIVGNARAIYEQDNESVVKYAKWGDVAATVRIYNAQEITKVAEGNEGRVDKAFAKLSICENAGTNGDQNLDKVTRKQLEDLGYVQ